jgi:hypothetical protein
MNKKIGFILAAISIYCFFYFSIPVTMVHSAQFFWAFVGSILTAVCIFMVGYKKPEEMYDIDNYKKNNGKQTVSIVLAVLVGLFGAFLLYFSFTKREEKFIEANPILVGGTVIDGVSKTSRKSSSYELTVSYKDSNAIEYKTDYNASSSEWNSAGKGMPVSVVFEKDHPEICKVILEAKDAMKYLGKGTKIYPTVNDLQAFLKTDDYNEQKKLLGKYWSVDKMEESEDGGYAFTNSVSKDNLAVMSLGNFYINEDQNDFTYNEILKEAKAKMKVVYDSMATNTTKGIMLQNDSMQIRFQSYTTSVQKKSGGEYNFSFAEMKKVYCFAFAKKNKMMILPGDLKGLEGLGDEEEKTNAISPEQIQDIIKSKTK